MKKIFLLIILFAAHTGFAQTDTTKQTEAPLILVEVMPKYPGGERKRVKFLQKNIKFPEAERKAKISGTCYITFVVEKDGSITEVKILRGVKDGPGYDAEAKRVVEMMPKWKPGTQNGRTVRVQFNMPIRFTP
jgi:protein TonB